MAGDWIKIRVDLVDDPDVFRMSDIMSIDCPTVVGHLVTFWSWVTRHTADGTDINVSERMIDSKVGLDGFAAALRSVGWLDGVDMALIIPEFSRHNGDSAKARALESEAKRLRRNVRQVSDKCPTNTAQNVRPEKRREEYITPLSQSEPVDNFQPSDETLEFCRMHRLPKPEQHHIAKFIAHHKQKRTHFRDDREQQNAFQKWMAGEKQQQTGDGNAKRETPAQLHARLNAPAFDG